MSFEPAEFKFQEVPGEVTRPLSLDRPLRKCLQTAVFCEHGLRAGKRFPALLL